MATSDERLVVGTVRNIIFYWSILVLCYLCFCQGFPLFDCLIRFTKFCIITGRTESDGVGSQEHGKNCSTDTLLFWYVLVSRKESGNVRINSFFKVSHCVWLERFYIGAVAFFIQRQKHWFHYFSGAQTFLLLLCYLVRLSFLTLMQDVPQSHPSPFKKPIFVRRR